jgi:phospholipid/cholesterol/gamma-HCH transport system substrate-binding protein
VAEEHSRDAGGDAEEKPSTLRRALVAGAVALAALVVWEVLQGPEPYKVTATFANAGQLVSGNEVVVGGARTGTVEEVELGPSNEALVTFTVADEYAPLKRGTTATVRSYSLSGIANRQVQLTLPPEGQAGTEIPSGGSLDQSETVSEVDLDEIFNTLDPETVEDFKHVIQGFERSYDGVGPQANRGFKYLNPFLSTSRRVFSELTFDERSLERLIVDASQLSGALAERAPDIEALIGNLNLMTNAIGRQKLALAESVAKLPNFMREANTTFVNLRAALDDVDPLVDASKPAAKKLQPFFAELRGATADAVPTIRDLDAIIKRSGKNNDLIELTRLNVPLRNGAIGSGSPDCSSLEAAQDDDFSQGSFGESVCALQNGTENLASLRAYTPDLTAWFDDFSSSSGTVDAMGGLGRIATTFNAGTISTGALDLSSLAPSFTGPGDGLTYGQVERCPGATERPADGSNPFTDGGTLDCDPSLIPPGP